MRRRIRAEAGRRVKGDEEMCRHVKVVIVGGKWAEYTKENELQENCKIRK